MPKDLAAKTVLVIDDDPFMTAFAESVLEPAGFQVELAANCGEGLEKADRLNPALVLLDYAMPGGDGAHFLRSMRPNALGARPGVIVVSAWQSAAARADVEGLGATWVDKPVSAERLVSMVRNAVSDDGSQSPN